MSRRPKDAVSGARPLAVIQGELAATFRALGEHEFAKRVADATIAQLAERALALKQEEKRAMEAQKGNVKP